MQFNYKKFNISVHIDRVDGHLSGTFTISSNGRVIRFEENLYVQGNQNDASQQISEIAKAYADRIEIGDLTPNT